MSEHETKSPIETDTPSRRLGQLFSTELGQQVVKDLLNREDVFHFQFREDPRYQAFEEGRKSLVMEILSSVGMLKGQTAVQTFYSYAIEDF